MTTQPLSQFNAGELSPLLLGRRDLPVYASGLRRATNTMVVPHGPVFRRPGTRRAGRAAPTTRKGITFEFGPGDAYSVEVVAGKLRFWRADRSQIMVDGQPYEIGAPWTAEQAKTLRWQQSGDVMWLTHVEVPMQELRRISLDPERFELKASVLLDGPYYAPNATATTVTAGGTGSGPIIFTASSPIFTPEKDIGRHFRVNATWGVITACSNATTVVVDIRGGSITSTDPVANWRLGLYSIGTGYPSCVCIHQERLTLGSNPANSFPRLDLSKTGAFWTFTPGTDDDSAIQAVLAFNSIPVIRDVVSQRVLVVITGAGAIRVSTNTASTALTPLNVDPSPLPTSTGGNNVRAIAAQGSVLYLDPQGASLGEIRAKSEIYADALGYREITIRSEHLLRDAPAISMAWADRPWNQWVAARADGALLMGAYAPDQEVIGFTPSWLADGGLVESVNVLPTFAGSEIWLLVNRGDVREFEVLSQVLKNTEPDREAVNVDQAITWRDMPQATLTRISGDVSKDVEQVWQANVDTFLAQHEGRAVRLLERDGTDAMNLPKWKERSIRILEVQDGRTIRGRAEGEAIEGPIAAGTWTRTATRIPGFAAHEGREIMALADGATVRKLQVADGWITLPFEASVVTGGLGYRSDVQPMPPNPVTRKGSAVGRPIDTPATRCTVVRSIDLRQVRWDGSLTGELPLRQGRQPIGRPPPSYTGDIVLDAAPEANTPVAPWLVSDGAGPFCITYIGPEYVVGEVG